MASRRSAARAAVLRRQVPVLSLVVVEAPAPQVLWHMGEHEHYRAFRQMTDAYFADAKLGKLNAVEKMIDFYGGAGTFAAWPQRVREYAARTTKSNLLDWDAAYNFELSPFALGNIDLPALVLYGGLSHPAVRRANELLAYYMPNASEMSIDGAAHFMISTHPKELAVVIGDHLNANSSAIIENPARLVG